MEHVFQRMVDRTRARLDVPQLRTPFGAKQRPRRTSRRIAGARLAIVLETPEYDLTVFKLHFGNLTLQAYPKASACFASKLSFTIPAIWAVVGSSHASPKSLPDWKTSWNASSPRSIAWTSPLLATQLSMTCHYRHSWADPPGRSRYQQAAHPLRSRGSPGTRHITTRFSVSQLAAKVSAMTTQPEREYTVRHAADDIKKLSAKGLVAKAGTSRRYTVQRCSLRAIAALLILREQVITPIHAGVRSPRIGRKPNTWAPADRHYEQLRVHMHRLFHELGIAA